MPASETPTAAAGTEFSRPDGPSWPPVVQTAFWIFKPVWLLRHLRARYGDTFTVRFLALGKITMLADPADIRNVFTAKADHLHAGEANIVLAPIVGTQSVLLLDEDRHLRQRRLLLPPFHGDRMRAYFETMREIADETIDRWPRGVPFRLREETQAITMDVILQVVFGITDETRRREFRNRMNDLDPNRWFKKFALMPVVNRIPSLQRRIFRDFNAQRSGLDNLIYEEIENRRSRADTVDRDDILSMLLQARDEDGNPMTDQELRDELMTLVIAGHETTATSLAWAFELMLRHPDVWRRVREEAATGEGSEYVDAVIKEALRMRPILPLVARIVKQPFTVAGHTLPPGSVVAPNIYLSHYREASHSDAEQFKPERFIGQSQPDGSTWLPFGGGIRRCIGASFALAEMRIVIQAIAQRVDLHLERPVPEAIVRRAITFSPENDVPIVVDDVRPARSAGTPESRAVA